MAVILYKVLQLISSLKGQSSSQLDRNGLAREEFNLNARKYATKTERQIQTNREAEKVSRFKDFSSRLDVSNIPKVILSNR